MFDIRISGIQEIIMGLLFMICGAYCFSLTALSVCETSCHWEILI